MAINTKNNIEFTQCDFNYAINNFCIPIDFKLSKFWRPKEGSVFLQKFFTILTMEDENDNAQF